MPVSSKQIIDKNKKIKPNTNSPMLKRNRDRKKIIPNKKPNTKNVKSDRVSDNRISSFY